MTTVVIYTNTHTHTHTYIHTIETRANRTTKSDRVNIGSVHIRRRWSNTGRTVTTAAAAGVAAAAAGNRSTWAAASIERTAWCRISFRGRARTPGWLANAVCTVWPSCAHA